MKISACLIVRDEVKSLPVCVASIREAVDEIVIVDTGSIDGTQEVAKQLADVYGEYTDWLKDDPGDSSTFHFSEARNNALEKATGDWILSVDADETLTPESIPWVRSACEQMPPHIDLILPLMKMMEEGRVIQQFLVERLFRSHVRFDLPQHNVINVSADNRTPCEAIVLLHSREHRPSEARAVRNKQRVAMARKWFIPRIEENPKDHRSLFYLAGTERDADNWKESLQWYDQYFKVATWDLERYQAGVHACQCLINLGRLEDARAIISAELIDNWQRAEGYFLLGQLAVMRGNWPEARHWFRISASMPLPSNEPFFLDVDVYHWMSHYNLARVNAVLGDWNAARVSRDAAIGGGAPEQVKYDLENLSGRKRPPAFKRLGFFVDRGQKDFLEPLFERWKDRYEMMMCSEVADVPEMLEWCEVGWFEWAGPLLIEATKLPKTRRLVVRVHGYELHSGLLEQVDWSKVDDVIFTAHYQRALATAKLPNLQQCSRFVAHAGADCSKFSIAPEKSGTKIGMACYLNAKKNIPLALQIAAKLPDHELHITGTWQDSRLALYCEKIVEELELQKRVFFEPWPEDLNVWFADKSFFLSTSIEESLEVSMAQGMAAGLCPVVHCWESSAEYYPHEQIFATVDQAVGMILRGAGDPEEWRQWALDRLDISIPARLIERIFQPPVVWVGMRDTLPHRIEHHLGAAVVNQGCLNCPEENPDMVLLCDPLAIDDQIKNATGKKVLWYAEQVMGDDEVSHRKIEMVKPGLDWCDVLVTSHREAGKTLLNGRDKEYLSLYLGGAHNGCMPLGRDRDIDVGFMGVMSSRRQAILDGLKDAGINVEVLSGEYDPGKVLEFYNRCKIIVNPHFTDARNNETRIAEALGCRCCVITEPLTEDQPFGLYPIQAETKDWPEIIKELLISGNWQTIAKDGERWIWSRLRLDQQVEKLLQGVGL